MVLEQLISISLWRESKHQHISYTVYRNQMKMDHRSKSKS